MELLDTPAAGYWMRGMRDYVDSHYARSLADAATYPSLGRAVETETCVIGGGLAGLATALELAARGRPVVLLEANRIGWGASGRSGGFVGVGFSLAPEKLVAWVGRDHARALYDLTREAVALVRARARGPLAPGLLECALAEEGDDALKAHRDFMAEALGVALEHWPQARLRAALKTARYADALLNPDGFHLHPLNFTREMARAAAAAGAALHEDSAVQVVALDGAIKEIRTAGGTARARHVVVACSGYLGRLVPRLAAATVPVATYVMTTAPLGERLASATTVPHAVLDTRFRSDYWRPLADTRLMWGGRVSSFHPPPAKVAALLRADMTKVFPQLVDVPVESAWSGTMGYARHKMPQIGELRDGVWYCMGFGGFGMAATTLGGRLIAGAIAERDDRIRLFAPFGLAYAGGRLAPAIAQFVYWGHGVRDWWRARRPSRAEGVSRV
jgi:gamma-glutamylputrescine oxidase